jgi:polyferredoxin
MHRKQLMKKEQPGITRKEAIKKLGKYAAFTTIGTYAILNPLKAAQTSPPDAGGDPTDPTPGPFN